jgi:hypothetical protein
VATQGEEKSEVLDPVVVSDPVPNVLVVLLRWPFQRFLRGHRPGWETGRPLRACPWCLPQRCPKSWAMAMLVHGGRGSSCVGDGAFGGSFCAFVGVEDVAGRQPPRCSTGRRPVQARLFGLVAPRNLQQVEPLSGSGLVSVYLVGTGA